MKFEDIENNLKAIIVFSNGRIIADNTFAEVLTDRDIVDRASLKETSLYQLAGTCGIADGTGFVQSFIDYERKERDIHE